MAELFKKKKGGKKGAKAPAAAPTPSKPWRKVGRGVALEHADVDEADVAARLEERSAAKAEKDYARADAIAARLQALGVAYDDATREWYVKKPKEAAPPAKKRERDGAPALKAVLADDDAPSSDEDDDEDDRLDDAFVARMQAAHRPAEAGPAKKRKTKK